MMQNIVATFFVASCLNTFFTTEPTRHEFESKHMGTSFRLVIYHEDAELANRAAKDAFARVAALEAVLSDYRADSEIMKLAKVNDAEPGKPIAISDDLARVLRLSLQLSEQSHGAFDVTVGPLSQLWRISRKTQEPTPPTKLQQARELVDYRMVKCDAKTLTLAKAGMRLDFGGIGKGFAVDEALALLKTKYDINCVLMAAAGDITCRGAPPGQAGWFVEIAPLRKGEPARQLILKDRSVSTSGDLEQVAVIGGVRYSHVLNPKTGVGLTGRRSVTVIGTSGATVDALTKAASVLSKDEIVKLFSKMKETEFYSVVIADDTKPAIVTQSDGFAEYLKH